MKEEDERLKQMLMDEEEEMRDDEILEQEEKSKLERWASFPSRVLYFLG